MIGADAARDWVVLVRPIVQSRIDPVTAVPGQFGLQVA